MATSTSISDFDLSLLVYGITFDTAEKKQLSNMMKKCASSENVKVVKYIEDKNIFVVNQQLFAHDRYYSDDGGSLEKTLAKADFKFVYNVFSRTNVILEDIKNTASLKAVQLLMQLLTRNQAFLTGFKNELFYKKYLGKDFLQFTDEFELEKYIFSILSAVKVDSTTLTRSPFYSINETKLSALFQALGWTENGHASSSKEGVVTLVLEKNNWRLFMMQDNFSSQYVGLNFNTNQHYSYIDQGRQFFNPGDCGLNKPLNDIGTVLTKEEIETLHEYIKTKSKHEIITRNLLDTLTNAKAKKVSFEKRQQTLSDALQKKVEYKIKLIQDGKESFKLNEIEYTRDGIEYSGQMIKVLKSNHSDIKTGLGAKVLESVYEEAKTNNAYEEKQRKRSNSNGHHYGYNSIRRKNGKRFQVDMFKGSTPVHSVNDITFDILYDEFMAYIFLGAVDKALNRIDTDVQLQVGDVKIHLKTKISTNVNNVKSVSVYLNDEKITRDDIHYCVHQAISYDTQKKYDEFLKSVSYTSLKIHKLEKGGVRLDFYDNLLQQQIALTIPVKRVKNKNYLVINGTDKRIRRTATILSLAKKNSVLDIVKTLVDNNVVENLKYTDLKGFIEKGQEAYAANQAKKEKLISDTIEALKIDKLDHVVLENGTTLANVYQVTGGLRSYYVESKDPFKIYSAKEGRYICMLDKTPYVSPEVKLINRFYALRNDSVISKEVATLDF